MVNVLGIFGFLDVLRALNAQSQKYLRVPLVYVLAALGSVLTIFLWLHEHDARVRQAYALEQVKAQTAASVSALESQATAAMQEANQQHAQAVRELEAREATLAQDSATLHDRVAALLVEEHSRLEQAATLPASMLPAEVARRLGPANQAARPGGSPSAVSGAAAGITPANGSPGSFELNEAGLRKVDEAFIELDSCRAQATALNQEVSSGQNQVATEAATIVEQEAAIQKLNQAIQAKDQVLAETEAAHQAELKIARGTRLGRLKRVLQHVAVGVMIGLVLR